jgi:hypothetical protein
MWCWPTPEWARTCPPSKRLCWGLGQAPGDNEVLDALGLPNGFEAMNQEEAEFMIDLMDTLLD